LATRVVGHPADQRARDTARHSLSSLADVAEVLNEDRECILERACDPHRRALGGAHHVGVHFEPPFGERIDLGPSIADRLQRDRRKSGQYAHGVGHPRRPDLRRDLLERLELLRERDSILEGVVTARQRGGDLPLELERAGHLRSREDTEIVAAPKRADLVAETFESLFLGLAQTARRVGGLLRRLELFPRTLQSHRLDTFEANDLVPDVVELLADLAHAALDVAPHHRRAANKDLGSRLELRELLLKPRLLLRKLADLLADVEDDTAPALGV